MIMFLLVVGVANLVGLILALRLLVNIGHNVAVLERYLRRQGIRMCYRDEEDLKREFGRKGRSRCDS
ncbi:MAG: hypothetical protein DIU79_16245 [Actinobacteria bacterium]|nr:MAG: hypothetical protein DIU79_16245 [Actinomycetota bacterium]